MDERRSGEDKERPSATNKNAEHNVWDLRR